MFNNAMQLDSTASWEQDKRKTNNVFDKHCQCSRIGYTDFSFSWKKKEKKFKTESSVQEQSMQITGSPLYLQDTTSCHWSPWNQWQKGINISPEATYLKMYSTGIYWAYSTATQWVLQSCCTYILKQKMSACKNLHYERNSLWNRLECTKDYCC